MNFARVILRVTDLERSVAFWTEKIGLALLFEAGDFAFLDAGGVQLVLNRASGAPGEVSQTELVFEVEDVAGRFLELQARSVPFEVALRPVTSDGDRDLLAAHFRDPDGHLASVTGWVGRA